MIILAGVVLRTFTWYNFVAVRSSYTLLSESYDDSSFYITAPVKSDRLTPYWTCEMCVDTLRVDRVK